MLLDLNQNNQLKEPLLSYDVKTSKMEFQKNQVYQVWTSPND